MNNYHVDLESDITCPGCDGVMLINQTYDRETKTYIITDQRCADCGYSI